MSSGPVFIGVKGHNGAINLIPTRPTTFWQRLGQRLAWLLGWGLWTLIAFFLGWMWGAL